MNRPIRAIVVALVASAALIPAVSSATSGPVTRGDAAIGRALVFRFLNDVKDKNVTDLRRFLSPAFQIQRADGSRSNKFQYLHDLPDVKSFKVRKMIVTSTSDEIVATYEVASDQIINGKQFNAAYAPRISAFAKERSGWQLVSHANFNTPKS